MRFLESEILFSWSVVWKLGQREETTDNGNRTIVKIKWDEVLTTPSHQNFM